MKEEIFLGKPISYWIEMKQGLQEKDPNEYLDEIVRLRGLISYYESKIKQLSEFMEKRGDI